MNEDLRPILVTTTSMLQDLHITHYLGFVTGEAVLGTEVFQSIFTGIRGIQGGRAAAYQAELAKARALALQELMDQARQLGANAVIAVDVDYQTVGDSMMLVSASGTAVYATP